jgi:hypothetical protein
MHAEQHRRHAALEEQAREALRRHPSFRCSDLNVECQEDVLIVRGYLPTFYLKQLLQTALLQVEGVVRIDNRVDVVRLQP